MTSQLTLFQKICKFAYVHTAYKGVFLFQSFSLIIRLTFFQLNKYNFSAKFFIFKYFFPVISFYCMFQIKSFLCTRYKNIPFSTASVFFYHIKSEPQHYDSYEKNSCTQKNILQKKSPPNHADIFYAESDFFAIQKGTKSF